MASLQDALAFARARQRAPGLLLRAPVGLGALAAWFGLSAPLSVSGLVHTLTRPGNFLPGQRLAVGYEESLAGVAYQADVYALGADGTPWKFWEANTDAWQAGVVVDTGIWPAGAPLIALTGHRPGIEGHDRTLQCYALSRWPDRLARIDQDQYGHPVPVLQPIDPALPPRAALAAFRADRHTVLAVDATGTLRLYRQDVPYPTPFGPLTGHAVSPPGLAPPGAPVAMAQRVSDYYAGAGPLEVYVVDAAGRLWAFSSADGEAWSGAPMPNPHGVVLPPGAHVAVGYQVNLAQQPVHGSKNLGYAQLDVFAVDADGTLQLWWESQGSPWTQQALPGGTALPPGAPITTGLQVYDEPLQRVHIGNQLDVFVVDVEGRVARWWVYQSGTWARDLLPDALRLPPGAHLATANQRLDSDGNYQQLAVFGVGPDGRILNFWQTQGDPWRSAPMPHSDLAVKPAPL